MFTVTVKTGRQTIVFEYEDIYLAKEMFSYTCLGLNADKLSVIDKGNWSDTERTTLFVDVESESVAYSVKLQKVAES